MTEPISIANVRKASDVSGVHGTYKAPCDVCQPLIDFFGIEDIHQEVNMNSEFLDEYVLKVLKKSGWSDDRKQDITSCVEILSEEGYIINDYAESVLKELGGLQIRTSGNENHLGVTLHFNPVVAASGEYDRMEIFNAASNEELFPIGECYDWVIYVSESKKIYLGDWMSLSIAGNSIEEFFNNIFNPKFQLKEIYTNDN